MSSKKVHGRVTTKARGSLVVAMVALFVALGSTAAAVGSAAVPLAKRALLADKAKLATTAKVATTARLAQKAKTATTAATTPVAKDAIALDGQAYGQFYRAIADAAVAQVLAQSPAGGRPTTSAARFHNSPSQLVNLGPSEERDVIVSCDLRQALHGGLMTFGGVFATDSHPTNNGTAWRLFLVNPDPSSAQAVVFASCF
jgi:hypothetical protein